MSLHLLTDCIVQSYKPFWPCDGSKLPLTTCMQSELKAPIEVPVIPVPVTPADMLVASRQLPLSAGSQRPVITILSALTVRHCLGVELHPVIRMVAPPSFVQVLRSANACMCGAILRRSINHSIHIGSRLQCSVIASAILLHQLVIHWPP